MNKLAVYVLSRNRQKYLGECVNSILSQDYKKFDLIISDNSSLIQIEDYLNQISNQANVIKRRPNISALDHFNIILQEACEKYDYVVLFHDDDIMESNFLSTCLETMARFPQAIASATNARLLYSDNLENKKNGSLFFKSNLKHLEIRSPTALIFRYSFPALLGFPPFPSYMYKTEFLRKIRMGEEFGGKYSDVGLLSQLSKKGPILWINDPLMIYRFHGTNDSNSTSLKDALRLYLFLGKNFPLTIPMNTYFFLKKFFKFLLLQIF